MKHSYVYENTRPMLVVESRGGASLGRCYNACYFRVTSRVKISRERMLKLRDAGFLGFGQEFSILSKCDGSEQPAGHDSLPCVECDSSTGKPTGRAPAINPYSGKQYEPIEEAYFVYDVETRVDSSD